MRDKHSMVEVELRARGALSAEELCIALGVSQPTISRLLSHMGARKLIRLGRGRSVRYALAREIGGKAGRVPVYTLDEAGRAQLFGWLEALEARQWCVAQESPWESLYGRLFRGGLFPGLPWFLDDLRPQGFLGRAFARQHGSDLGVSPDPRDWRADDIVLALTRYGQDLPGAFILGDAMLGAVQERLIGGVNVIPVAGREHVYPVRAEAALTGEWPGSSAAGEQPKFTACLADAGGGLRHVIVKFSGSGGRPEDQRWSDLLVAEHLASVVLAEQGIPAAETCLLESGGRRFLESTRFDRVGAHGRRGVVSLMALDSAFYGSMDTPWTAAAERLFRDRRLTAADAGRLSALWWFGTLIGNTDMHYGNVSLFLGPDLPFSLAPCYDMLPMMYRPGLEGALSDKLLTPLPPPPQAVPVWTQASAWAQLYWSRVAEFPALSTGFRAIAGQNAITLGQYRERFCRG